MRGPSIEGFISFLLCLRLCMQCSSIKLLQIACRGEKREAEN
jgi:hypothetical protein